MVLVVGLLILVEKIGHDKRFSRHMRSLDDLGKTIVEVVSFQIQNAPTTCFSKSKLD